MLGDTLEKIAIEKAGIIKQNSFVVVCPNCHTYEIFKEKAK